MKTKKRYVFTGSVWGYIGITVLLACLLGAGSAEAVLTPQSISGTVEVLLAGQQAWTPLTASMKLKAGDQIRTGADGSVDLWFEDGSVLNVAQETQLGMNELDISTARKTRVARFKLWWGGVTAKITKLAFDTSAFEVETNTVVAGIKFSEMTVKALKDTSHTEVTASQGAIKVLKIGEGIANVLGLVDDQDGVAFPLDTVGTEVLINVQKILRKITVESNAPIRFLRALIGPKDNMLKVDNANPASVEVNYAGEITTILEQDSAATFGVPGSAELTVSAESMNASFLFMYRATLLCPTGEYISAEKGSVFINGKKQEPGSFDCIPVTGGKKTTRALPAPEEAPARTLSQEGEEEREAPPGSRIVSPEGSQEPEPEPSPEPTQETPPSGTGDTLSPPPPEEEDASPHN